MRIRFRGSVSPDLLGLVSENTKSRWPSMTLMMTGDVAWQLPDPALRRTSVCGMTPRV
jgi:hypothetical protein